MPPVTIRLIMRCWIEISRMLLLLPTMHASCSPEFVDLCPDTTTIIRVTKFYIVITSVHSLPLDHVT